MEGSMSYLQAPLNLREGDSWPKEFLFDLRRNTNTSGWAWQFLFVHSATISLPGKEWEKEWPSLSWKNNNDSFGIEHWVMFSEEKFQLYQRLHPFFCPSWRTIVISLWEERPLCHWLNLLSFQEKSHPVPYMPPTNTAVFLYSPNGNFRALSKVRAN